MEFLEQRADQMRVQMQEVNDAATAAKQALEGKLAEQQTNILRLETELGSATSEAEALRARLEGRLAELEAKQNDLEQQLAVRADAAHRAQQALAVALKVLD
jgi:hypothetical protein